MAAALLLNGRAHAAANALRDLAAPCATSAPAPGVSGSPGIRLCSVAIPEAQAQIQTRVQDQVDGYYNGCDVDPLAPIPANLPAGAKPNTAAYCQGKAYPRETCNPMTWPGTFQNAMAEGVGSNGKNHIGASCGSWAYFTTQISGHTCSITPLHTGGYFEREDSFTRGAWIEAISCYHEQVKNEVNKNKLTLTGVGGVDGPCAAMAAQYDTALKSADATAKDLRARLVGEVAIGDIENCLNPPAASASTSPDVGPLRQTACQLIAARKALETMFTHLAVCEIMTRAQRSNQQFLAAIGGKQGTLGDIVARVLNGTPGNTSTCNSSYVLGQYQTEYLALFNARANAVWNQQVCQ